MATLIIDLHCMCLFVPDEDTGSMHVLMPSTDGHEKHVVRMLHKSFVGQKTGRSMEGWALVLDDEQGRARTTLTPAVKIQEESEVEIADLTELTREFASSALTVSPALVTSLRAEGVACRITFRAGEVTEVRSPSKGITKELWSLGGKERVLAGQVTWTIKNVPDTLTWIRLGAAGPPPLRSLRELAPEGDDVFRISIYHVTEASLPPGEGTELKPEQVQHHFAAFYTALGMQLDGPTRSQQDRLLPTFLGAKGNGGETEKDADVKKKAPVIMCKMARVTLARPEQAPTS